MKTLSGLDSAFLSAETPSTPMNVVATVVVDPDAEGHPLPYEEVIRRLEERIHLLPPFTRKLVEVPFELDHPVWVEDTDFDLRSHVLRVMASAPGGNRELAALVARASASRLDRSRPLWEMWFVEGLAGNRVSLIFKSHHAALDGVSGATLLVRLFDGFGDESAVNSVPAIAALPPQLPEAVSAAGHALRRLPERLGTVAGAAIEAAGTVGRVARARNSSSSRQSASPFSGPVTRFNGPVSKTRSVAYARCPLEHVKQVRTVFGGTINDVVMAACTTGLRRFLDARGELPDVPLVAAVPVSTRSVEDGPCGNRISAMLVDLPVHLPNPLSRYAEVRRSAKVGKRFHSTLGLKTMEAFAELSVPALTRRALGLYSAFGLSGKHAPLHNVTISNVPGPFFPLTFDGRVVHSIHPHGPLIEGVGLNITVLSYHESIDVGVLACGRALPQAEELADGIAVGIEQMLKLADREASGDGLPGIVDLG